MNVCDPIADLLTRIRNAQKAQHDYVKIPASRVKIAIVGLLKKEGYIRTFRCVRDNKQGMIKVALKYRSGISSESKVGAIRSIDRVSKPGLRKYVSARQLPQVKNGFGIGILSTAEGIMTSEDAASRNIGGEYICAVY